MKKLAVAAAALVALPLAGCSSDADVASQNLSKAAEQFEIMRRIIFFNGITDT
jgi:outer membrane murein-binding lipoprotein Lpp